MRTAKRHGVSRLDRSWYRSAGYSKSHTPVKVPAQYAGIQAGSCKSDVAVGPKKKEGRFRYAGADKLAVVCRIVGHAVGEDEAAQFRRVFGKRVLSDRDEIETG